MSRRHPPMPSIPRWLRWVSWGSVALAVVVLFGIWPLSGSDLLMHLTLGRWIVQHGSVPRVDEWSYVSAGQEFIAHSWLAELVFYRLEQAAGTVGFTLLQFGLISVALLCTLRVAQLLKAPWTATIVLAPVVLALMWARLEFRPQLFTTAFLAFELLLLISVHTGQRSWLWLWGLPPLFALWVNLHGGWPQGVAILAAIAVAVALRPRMSQIPRRPLLLVIGACLVALLCNPYGLRLVTFPVDTMQTTWIQDLVAGSEWQAPWFNAGWRTVGGGRLVPLQAVFYGYVALLVAVLAVMVRRWRTVDLVPLMVMALWLALGAYHLRTVSDMALLTGPLVAASCRSRAWQSRQWPLWAGSVGALALVVVALWGASHYRDWRWTRGEPICVEAAVARWGRPVRAFGRPELTDWLLYTLPGRVTVSHTFDYVTGRENLAALSAVWQGRASWQLWLDRYGVDVVLLNAGASRTVSRLTAMGWHIIHLEDRWVVLGRPGEAGEIPSYYFIKPWTNESVTPANAPAVLEEANRALAECPAGATFAWAYKAEALWLLGREAEALEAGANIPSKLIIR
jgi:hypothetical protein